MSHEEKMLESNLLYQGKIVSLYRDVVLLENGEQAFREVVRHAGGVAVMAVTEDKQVYMVRQYRYPYAQMLLEVPAGKINVGEDPLLCGMRELEEETGMTASDYRDLGNVYPSVGYDDEIIYCYLATGLQKGEQCLDEDEFLDVELIPLEDLYQMVMNGEIQDSKTQIMILKAYQILK